MKITILSLALMLVGLILVLTSIGPKRVEQSYYYLATITHQFKYRGFSSTLLNLVNEHRNQKGLREIEMNYRFCQYGYERAKEVVLNWSHDGFDRDDVCQECKNVGENLSRKKMDPHVIFEAWLNSPSHRALIEGNYSFGCVGVYSDKDNFITALEVGV